MHIYIHSTLLGAHLFSTKNTVLLTLLYVSKDQASMMVTLNFPCHSHSFSEPGSVPISLGIRPGLQGRDTSEQLSHGLGEWCVLQSPLRTLSSCLTYYIHSECLLISLSLSAPSSTIFPGNSDISTSLSLSHIWPLPGFEKPS